MPPRLTFVIAKTPIDGGKGAWFSNECAWVDDVILEIASQPSATGNLC